MRTMVAIDYFYHDDVRNILVAGDRGLVYLSDCSTDDLLTVLCESHGRSVNGSMELFAKINQANSEPIIAFPMPGKTPQMPYFQPVPPA